MNERPDHLDPEEVDDSISLQPLLHKLWVYRRVMGVMLLVTMVAAATVLIVAYLVSPKERYASLAFRLTFDGADRDEFPNGTKFSASEIVATPVLDQVFRMNDLQRYMTLEDLKRAMFVLQANGDVEILSYEYQTKLADSKLTAVDRARIEEEFRKKRDSFKSADYSINLVRRERLLNVPTATLNKILQDTLAVWAQQAADRKGAIRYNIPMVSKQALSKNILTSGSEPVVVADQLRAKAMFIQRIVAGLIGLPGALAVRTDDTQATLGDVRVTLDDLVRLKLEPLIVRLRGTSTRDPLSVQRYFDGRYLQAQLERDDQQRRLAGLEDAMRTYLQQGGKGAGEATTPGSGIREGAVIPQLSESFIDRLLAMSGGATDLEFRQKLTNRTIDQSVNVAESSRQVQFYESMRTGLTGSAPPPETTSQILESAYADLSKVIDQIEVLYKRIAEQNLNPSTVLYSVNGPFIERTTPALSARTALFYFLAAILTALLVAPLASLAHAYSGYVIAPSAHVVHADGVTPTHRPGAGPPHS